MLWEFQRSPRQHVFRVRTAVLRKYLHAHDDMSPGDKVKHRNTQQAIKYIVFYVFCYPIQYQLGIFQCFIFHLALFERTLQHILPFYQFQQHFFYPIQPSFHIFLSCFYRLHYISYMVFMRSVYLLPLVGRPYRVIHTIL